MSNKPLEKSKSEMLKSITAEKKKLREQEKELKLELDANKGKRKESRQNVTRTKVEAFEKRQLLTNALRMINKAMLTKSIKNNIDDFRDAVDEFYKSSSEFIHAANEHIDAIEVLEKYE
jgi:uncharacterized membrane protein YgaE (UPF0421/DUF939 family)